MNLELGLILAFAIVAVGGVGLAGFVLWLRNRESETSHHNHSGAKHA
ncbi:MAG: hypothetical protein PHQ60_01990 [Sideroxydans sp.]|nr:hypothetical protein [Sideroxydans sp.]MDD5056613.1 hypothetical protein [Sideroxydans sp.]